MNWSFKRRSGSFGAALNYLEQDMQGERDGAVEYMNIAVNPAVEMQATVDASRQLKSGKGAKNERPVFHYTLSWHPDDQPDSVHMVAQAKHTLTLLGLDQHQAVIKQHRDRDHAHVHILANLVHPATGRTASLSHYKLKLDSWAHEYEVARQIRSPKRAARHEGRKMERKPDTDLSKRKAELRQKLNKNYARREKEKEHLWDKFRVDQSIIRETAQSQLDEIWKRKPTERTREPAGPKLPRKEQELKLWAKAMKMLAPDHIRPHARMNFREALTKIAAKDRSASSNFGQAKNPKLSRPLEQHKEGRDIMLPARNTAAARRYAAVARQTKKQRSEEIRAARDVEIQNCANLYARDKEALKSGHDAEIKAEKQERVALWREGKKEQAEAVRGTAKEQFKRVASEPEPTEQQVPEAAPEQPKVSRAKELYEELAEELRTKHGYSDERIASALRQKADSLNPAGWREKTEWEEMREASIRLGNPASPDTLESDKPYIARQAIDSFVSRLSDELQLPAFETYDALQHLANEQWEQTGPHSRWANRDREEGRNLTLEEHVEADWQDIQRQLADDQEAAPTKETSWHDRIDAVEQSTVPEQDNGTGTWRDAANGPDWSAPTPDKGNDRGGRGM